ncbi:MAG: hypothetical protein NTY51_03380 [Deltaproteobacteria bacterium]|nr:hypothetical protein [Deltaproteobacteria bacterium]
MRKPKAKQVSLRADQLLCAGDIVTVMDDGSPTSCKVLSCLGTNDGSCFASLEILEGPKKGSKLETSLVAREQKTE